MIRVKFVIVNVTTAAKSQPKLGASQQHVASATFQLLPCAKMGNYD